LILILVVEINVFEDHNWSVLISQVSKQCECPGKWLTKALTQKLN